MSCARWIRRRKSPTWPCCCDCFLFRKATAHFYSGRSSIEKAEEFFSKKVSLLKLNADVLKIGYLLTKNVFQQKTILKWTKLCFLFCLGAAHFPKKQLKEHFPTILLPCKSYSVVANLSLSGLKCFTKCERSFRDSHQSRIERNRVYQRSVLTKERPKTNSLSIVCFVSLFSF